MDGKNSKRDESSLDDEIYLQKIICTIFENENNTLNKKLIGNTEKYLITSRTLKKNSRNLLKTLRDIRTNLNVSQDRIISQETYENSLPTILKYRGRDTSKVIDSINEETACLTNRLNKLRHKLRQSVSSLHKYKSDRCGDTNYVNRNRFMLETMVKPVTALETRFAHTLFDMHNASIINKSYRKCFELVLKSLRHANARCMLMKNQLETETADFNKCLVLSSSSQQLKKETNEFYTQMLKDFSTDTRLRNITLFDLKKEITKRMDHCVKIKLNTFAPYATFYSEVSANRTQHRMRMADEQQEILDSSLQAIMQVTGVTKYTEIVERFDELMSRHRYLNEQVEKKRISLKNMVEKISIKESEYTDYKLRDKIDLERFELHKSQLKERIAHKNEHTKTITDEVLMSADLVRKIQETLMSFIASIQEVKIPALCNSNSAFVQTCNNLLATPKEQLDAIRAAINIITANVGDFSLETVSSLSLLHTNQENSRINIRPQASNDLLRNSDKSLTVIQMHRNQKEKNKIELERLMLANGNKDTKK